MFTAGFVQFQPARHDVARKCELVESLLRDVRADLLVLPELANSGYLYATPAAIEPFSEPGDGSGPFLSTLRRLAARTGGAIVTGFAERTPAGLFNSAAAVDASGVQHLYRKTHLFSTEQDLFKPGDTGFGVWSYRGARIGLMICFDWYFPESARTLALRGAQLLAHPSNLVLPHCQASMATRCLENRVFAVTTNRFGTEQLGDTTLTFTGASQVMDTVGVRLAQAGVADACVGLAEIDPALADNKHPTERNDLFLDRRPEFYQ